MAGLDNSGFTRKLLPEIIEEIKQDFRDSLGAGLNLNPPSKFGTLIGIISKGLDELWQLAEDTYNSQYPGSASGVPLDNVVAITGIRRLDATKSKALQVHLFGTAGITISGVILSVQGNPQARFVQVNPVTLVAGVNEVQTISFSAAPTGGSMRLRYRGVDTAILNHTTTASDVQTALNNLARLSGVSVTGSFGAGFVVTFGGADGKQDQPLLEVVSNTLIDGVTPVVASVVQTVQGQSQARVDFEAEAYGPVLAPAESLTVIETPVAGLDSVRNTDDAISGRNLETDSELRLRRERTLQVAGAGTLDAIRSQLLTLAGVTSVLMFENRTLVTDGDGRPGKSYEAVVQGGTPSEITQTVWNTKPAGIETHGNQTGIATDSQSQPQTVKWSRPVEVDIWVIANLTTDSGYPANGDQLVRDAIVEHINELGIGTDVVVIPKLICVLDQIPGIIDAEILVGTAPSPTLDNNIVIAPAQIAQTDTAKVVVNS